MPSSDVVAEADVRHVGRGRSPPRGTSGPGEPRFSNKHELEDGTAAATRHDPNRGSLRERSGLLSLCAAAISCVRPTAGMGSRPPGENAPSIQFGSVRSGVKLSAHQQRDIPTDKEPKALHQSGTTPKSSHPEPGPATH